MLQPRMNKKCALKSFGMIQGSFFALGLFSPEFPDVWQKKAGFSCVSPLANFGKT